MLKRVWIWIRCMVWFHDVYVVQELTPMARKLRCGRCDRYFAMNDEHRAFLEWDEDFESFYCGLLEIKRTHR